LLSSFPVLLRPYTTVDADKVTITNVADARRRQLLAGSITVVGRCRFTLD